LVEFFKQRKKVIEIKRASPTKINYLTIKREVAVRKVVNLK